MTICNARRMDIHDDPLLSLKSGEQFFHEIICSVDFAGLVLTSIVSVSVFIGIFASYSALFGFPFAASMNTGFY